MFIYGGKEIFSLSKLVTNFVSTRYRFLNDENNDVWRMHCIRKLAEEALKSELLSSTPTYKVQAPTYKVQAPT